MGSRHVLLAFGVTALCAAGALLGGCGKEIGDACTIASDCSPNGDRICQCSNCSGTDPTSDSANGYCTVQGCDFGTCPSEAVCVRFFTVYGPRQRPDMAIAKFTGAIARGEPIALFGDGTTRRDYTFIDDIVTGVVASIGAVAPGCYELINLGGTHTTSLRELVEILERVIGRPAVVDWQPSQPGDVPLTYASIDRARALLGYEPTTRPEVGIARYWAWCQSRGA